jgi:hypothetical protein
MTQVTPEPSVLDHHQSKFSTYKRARAERRRSVTEVDMDREEKMQWTLSKEKRLVTIKLSTREFDFTAEHLSSFIHSLEHIRAKMQPEVPASFPKGRAYKANLEPTPATAH